MAEIDRLAVIALLERLGADDDATVLQAGRDLHRLMSDSGLSWDDILGHTAPLAEQEVTAAGAPPEPVGTLASKSKSARLVERMLARKNLSGNLREELTEFKQMIAADGLDDMDERYIRALAKRLGV